MTPLVAVIIATKNRSDDIARHALSSLERSTFRDFVCVVWDASDDDKTEKAVDGKTWNFQLQYVEAPRVGSSSQRNDAVERVLLSYPSVRYVFFMDDDSEISPDALDGILATFALPDVSFVNLPMYPTNAGEGEARWAACIKRWLGWNRYGATDFLYNYKSGEGEPGKLADWAGGSGMTAEVGVFREGYRFPEDFQRFGGYALGEDFAFTFYLYRKKGRRIVNSLGGHFLHFPARKGRLNVFGMAASKWYNFHLLFAALYDDIHGARLLWLKLKFKLFMVIAALKCLVRARSLNPLPALRGIREARKALKEYPKSKDIQKLFCKQ
ncbi:MAG: glycosyltransferase [Fretibacterium sp.]|nr:glycosyltransferase [Fretibacterium sp.]